MLKIGKIFEKVKNTTGKTGSVQKTASSPIKQNGGQQPAATAPKTLSAGSTTSKPQLSGNGNSGLSGNGASSTISSSKFAYENSSIFNDSTKKSGKDAMKTIQGSKFFKGGNDTKESGRMCKQLSEIQTNCKRWNVAMDADGDGTKETKSLAETVAESYDSVLDLYISEQVESMMNKYGTGTSHGGYLSDAALKELAMKGIRVDSVGDNSNRIYSFSLIDVEDDIRALMAKESKSDADMKTIYDAVYSKDGKIMEDSNGKKGSCVFADCLVPDGSAQKCEINLASILDQMGYDCISKADFIDKESDYMELISQVEGNINDGSYHELNKGKQGQTINDMYGTVKSIRESLNKLWGHDTAGSGKVYGNALGSGSFIGSSSDYAYSGESGVNGTNDSTDEADNNAQLENSKEAAKKKTKAAKEEKAEEQKTEKLDNKSKGEKDAIKRYALENADKIITELFESNENLSKSEKIEVAAKVTKAVNKQFNLEMTNNDIYATIF